MNKANSGFSVMEILVGILLLSIIIAAFTPLFLRMSEIILSAGNLSVEFFQATGEVEKQRAESFALKGGKVTIDFDGDLSFEVEGGIIESGNLTTFIANVPTMSLQPHEFNEGYKPNKIIQSLGTNTHFSTADSEVQIINRDGILIPSALYDDSLKNVEDETEAEIHLTGNMTNASSPYIVTISTSGVSGLPAGMEENVRAQITIHLPLGMIVGKDKVFITDGDIHEWQERNTFSDSLIKSVAYGSTSFLIVGEEVEDNEVIIKRLAYGEDWVNVTDATSNMINKVRRAKRLFIAVGENGTVLYSNKGLNWDEEEELDVLFVTEQDDIIFQDLAVKEVNSSDVLVLIGEREDNCGIIVSIKEAEEEEVPRIIENLDPPFPPLRGVAAGNDSEDIDHFIAVGEDGFILKSTDG